MDIFARALGYAVMIAASIGVLGVAFLKVADLLMDRSEACRELIKWARQKRREERDRLGG